MIGEITRVEERFSNDRRKKGKKYRLLLFEKPSNKTGSNVVIHHMSHQIPRIAKWPIYRGGNCNDFAKWTILDFLNNSLDKMDIDYCDQLSPT